ncbi:hypothetical protein BP6252_01224 [Coleophoma cylindrospora]|uniref:Zn(2)-C6 fungal-type domain-containing protein n=1 Tax=Coleophoma cylindrospora TaxID=1849047 RepID=A0A3D8SSC2_9HELO|nr:hypothetical protein BP6252_01224 [Coleophoma cylindrospora]
MADVDAVGLNEWQFQSGSTSPSKDNQEPSPDPAPKPLSCKRCRQRKIKCDRGTPCATCRRFGMECAYPPRVRTRRDPRKHQELLDRIARLENLVTQTAETRPPEVPVQFHAQEIQPNPALYQIPSAEQEGIWVTESDRPLSYAKPGPHKSNETHQASNHFWSSLTAEVDGLKQLLDEPSEDEEEEDNPKSTPPAHQSSQPMTSVLFNEPTEMVDLRAFHPSVAHARTLCDIYFARVDPVCKILHKPTVRSTIFARAHDLEVLAGERSLEALMFAVYFAAVCSVSNTECIKYFGQSKDVLSERYRFASSAALHNANFLDDVDFVSLQALVIFLVCFRHGSGSRKAWTLLSVAIRIAQALGLHRESSGSVFTPFETEMRRRLWWQLCIHDIWQSEDRAFDPIITEINFTTLRPANIDDEDLDPSDLRPIVSRDGPTIMAFSLIGYEAYTLYSRLHFAPSVDPKTKIKNEAPVRWQQKEALAKEFCDILEEKVIKYCDTNDPYFWMCSTLAKNMQLKAFIILRFPMRSSDMPTAPLVSKDLVLGNCVIYFKLLEDLTNNQKTIPWQWMLGTWKQWHPLAVTLAELCTYKQGPVAEIGWEIINIVYEKYEERVSDAKGSRLWRPIKKLYQTAKKAREMASFASLQSQGQQTPTTYSWDSIEAYAASLRIADGPTLQPRTVLAYDPSGVPLTSDYGQQHCQNISMNQFNDLVFPADSAMLNTRPMEPIDWAAWNQFLADTLDVDGTLYNNLDSMNG